MQNLPENKLYTIGEAAGFLGISINTLKRWEKKGRILAGRTPTGIRVFKGQDIASLKSTFEPNYLAHTVSKIKTSYPIPSSYKLAFLILCFLLILLSGITLFTVFQYSPFPQTLSERIASIEAGLKDKASGLLVNLVEEGVKNKVSVGEQVLLAEIPQDLSINSLTLSDDLRVGGDTSIEGTLTVSSESNLYSLNVNNNLNVTGDSLLTGSLNVGGTINGSTLSSTALTFTGTSASIYPSSSDTSLFLNGGTTGTVNIGNSSTGDIHIGGGTQSSGCTITNNNGSLNCSSDITSSGNLRVNGGTLSTTQTTLSIDVADSGSINFRDSSNTLVSITDEGTTGNINVTGIYKIGGTTGKTIATCGSSQYLGGIAITGGIVTTLGNCNDVSSTTGTDLTLSGDLAVNGGDITSTSSTFNLLNQPTTLNIGSTNVTRAVNIGTGTNADTINIGTGTGTADTINIGGISGTTVNITGGTVNITGNLVSTGTVQGTRLISTIATGTAPLTVASTTVVPNLNASLLEGNSASTVMSQPQPNLVLNSDFGRRNKWMTFMPETFTDTSGYIQVTGTSSVSSNQLTPTLSGGHFQASWGLTTWRDIRASLSYKYDTSERWLLIRYVDSNNYIAARTWNSNFYIMKRIAGTNTVVASTAITEIAVNDWAWLEIEMQGTTVTAKLYDQNSTSPGAKSATTLIWTRTGTVSDSEVAAGKVGYETESTLPIGGISSGDGGAYVEGWGPESWDATFVGSVKGGESIGFDESADSGPVGIAGAAPKQWTMRAYIPAASRAITLAQMTPDGSVNSSTSHSMSGYFKVSGKGGSGELLTLTFDRHNSAGTYVAGTDINDAGETSWTRKSSTITTESGTRRVNTRWKINQALTATGTAYFQLPQLEQGSVVTPWRNSSADDDPITWVVRWGTQQPAPDRGFPSGIDFTTNTYTSFDNSRAGINLFMPWDGNINASLAYIYLVNLGPGPAYAGVALDGTVPSYAIDATTFMEDRWYEAGSGNSLTRQHTSQALSVTAGKHRLNAMGKVDANLLRIYGYPNGAGAMTVTATRGKFDLAEEYSVSDQSIEAGDIVRLAPGSGSTTVEKTIGGYSQDILGIISTDPGITLGNYNSSDGSIIDGNYQSRYGQGSTLRPVALQGRVPVKVTSENGPIKRGDILTSSATLPGYAMKAIKAGRSIGVAMEPFGTDVPQDAGSSSLGSSLSPTVDSVTGLPVEEVKVGKVMTFVNLSFYDPQVYITDSGTLSVIKVGSTPVLLSSSSTGGVGGDITIDNSTTETKQSFTYQIQDRVTKEIIERIGAFNNLFVANLKVGSIDVDKIESKEIDQLKLSLTDLLTNQASLSGRIEFLENTASNSGVLGVLGSSTYTEGTPSASFNDLTIFNKLITTNLGVTGTIQSGLLSIEGINSLGNSAINTLNGDLYLQNNLLGGVNILSGKVLIDKDGNLKIENKITAQTVEAEKFVSTKAAGSSVLPANTASIDVISQNATENARILITPTTLTDRILTVISKDTGKFTVSIKQLENQDIKFDWFIIN